MLMQGEEPIRLNGRVRRGRANADAKTRFEAIALPHLDALYRMACMLTIDRAEADDLVQETFVRAFRGFDRFELREYGARPWLLRILHNVFYSTRGKRRREPILLDDVDFDHFADESHGAGSNGRKDGGIDWEDVDEELRAAVDDLPSEYRLVLMLWSIEGYSYKEIAAVCDCPLGTVMSRLYRARQSLGKRLQRYAHERKIGTRSFD